MVELAQIRRILLQVLNDLQPTFGHRPLLGVLALEVLVPGVDQREFVEREADAFQAHHRGDEREIGDCDVVGDDVFLADALQILLEHFQRHMDSLQASSISRILKINFIELSPIMNCSIDYLKKDRRKSVGRNCAVEVGHVVAQAMIDQRPERRVFRIRFRVGSVFVTDVLHDGDVLAQEKSVVVQNWNLPLRVQLKNFKNS